MARFQGFVSTGQGKTTRLNPSSVELNGWESGVKLTTNGSQSGDADVFEVWATGGSNGSRSRLLGRLVNGIWEPTVHQGSQPG